MSILIEGLPNDIAIRCLARVPYYLFPKLETVSYSWWAAVHSTEFYKARQETNSIESLLCVCAVDPENIWQLYDPIRDIWLTLPLLPSVVHLVHFGVASVSGKLFVLGGDSGGHGTVSTNEVWAYDPVYRQWAQRAPMIVPRASFACCVWNGKILVAGGFTAPKKSTSKAEIYDPNTDTWDPIPDLDRVHDSPCIGFVIDDVVHVVHVVNSNTVLNQVQVLENLEDKWRHSHSLNKGLITVVNGSLYRMTLGFGEIYKEEPGGICKSVVKHKYSDRMGFAIMGFCDDIYVIGGFIMCGGGDIYYPKVSDVGVLVLGNENESPVWKKVASMTRCQGSILGCAELRI